MERRTLVHEGFLRKSPPEHKIEKNYKWHKRLCRLWSDRTFEYYKEVDDPRPLKEPIDLRRCEDATSYDCEQHRKFGKKKWTWFFKLKTPERSYHFIAPSKTDMDLWILHINTLCMSEASSDVMDGATFVNDTDNPRSSSVSSRSAWSTSSSSNRSSPGVNRINTIHAKPSSPQESSTRQRIMSIPPDYRVPRSQTVSVDSRDLGYDVLTATPRTVDSVYHVPPEPKPLITHSPMNSIKQTPTTTKIEDDSPTGYVQMTPDDYVAPYIPMDRKLPFEVSSPSSEKVFKPMPFLNKSQTLPQRPTMLHEWSVMDEIPDLKDKKKMKDLKEDPPQVNRMNKPPPRVDRANKPSVTLPPRLNYTSPTSEQAPVFQVMTDTDDGMSEVHRFAKYDNPFNNYSTPRSYHPSNTSSIRKSSHDLNPPNQPITHDSRGQKITVGHSAHIHLQNPPVPAPPLDYSTEPLPLSPYENSFRSTSSTTSSSSDLSYVNDDIFNEVPNNDYENVKNQTTNRVLRYSEVESDHWVQNDGSEARSSVEPVTASDEKDATGTHYVFVDTAKSDAVKLTIQDRRNESCRKSSLY